MCFGFLRAAGNCVRALFALLCCLICGGPILFIVGLVLLFSDNDRGDQVNEFNRAVASQDEGTVNSWAPGTIGGAAANPTSLPIDIEGNTEDVVSASSRVVRASPSVSGSTFSLAYALTGVTSFTRSNIAQSRRLQRRAYCDNSNGCSFSQMQDYCEARYGGSATFSENGDSCRRRRGDCGQCSYDAFLTDYCVVLDGSEPPYAESTRYRSCYYPFGSADQSYEAQAAAATITATVMAASDPYIVLQRLTEGTRDFGVTREAQRNAGIVCLVIGIILIVCIALVGFFAYRLFTKDKRQKHDHPSTAPLPPNQSHFHQPQPSTNPQFQQQQQPMTYNNAPAAGNNYYGGGNNYPAQGVPLSTAPANNQPYGYGYGQPPPQQQQQQQPSYGYGY